MNAVHILKIMYKKTVKERISEKDWEKLQTKRLEEELENHNDCYTTVQGQHQHCPEGEDSWCKWKKTEREKAEREKEKEMEKNGMETATEQEDEKEKEKEKKEREEKEKEEALAKRGLAHCFYDALKPHFDKLSDSKRLERCKDGFTQNQNESFNAMPLNISILDIE